VPVGYDGEIMIALTGQHIHFNSAHLNFMSSHISMALCNVVQSIFYR